MDFSMVKEYKQTDQEERFQENGLKDREDEINIYSTTFDQCNRSKYLFLFENIIQTINLFYFQLQLKIEKFYVPQLNQYFL
ncbi:unnamed protein product [Paramecium primaurelia]|uniref:Uncharacterized protein n=1 Tax=Paramecium primaurelia TaxID=5886 RepID=A0A8S1NU08_PARPR|nr:unnamed protein product [Paramecium primaurelia]